MSTEPEPLDPEEAIEMMNDGSDEEMVDLDDVEDEQE